MSIEISEERTPDINEFERISLVASARSFVKDSNNYLSESSRKCKEEVLRQAQTLGATHIYDFGEFTSIEFSGFRILYSGIAYRKRQKPLP